MKCLYDKWWTWPVQPSAVPGALKWVHPYLRSQATGSRLSVRESPPTNILVPSIRCTCDVCVNIQAPKAMSYRLESLRSCGEHMVRLRDDSEDTQPFPIPSDQPVDNIDTKPPRVDSFLIPKHDLIDKIYEDATKRESVEESKCPKCGSGVYYRSAFSVECIGPSCENYRFSR